MPRLKHRFDDFLHINAVPGVTIKHKDYFHMKDMYEIMHEWLIDEGWATRADETFPERFYYQRETQKAGRELWIFWRLEKFPYNTYNSYYKFFLDIDFHIILMKDVEVVRHGLKYKTHHGEPEIRFTSNVIMDWQGKWAKNWFLKHVHEAFRKRIFWKELDTHKRELYRETYRFQEMLKTYLKLSTYLPEPEGEQFYRTEDFD